MKKALRLKLTGNLQSMYFKQYIKANAEANRVTGFLRSLEDGRAEIFLQGQSEDVDNMIKICSEGPKFATIRSIEKTEERLQDFKEFKVLRF